MNKPKIRQFTYQGKTYAYELYLGGVKRINLRVRPNGTIRVSAPHLTPARHIDAFLMRCGDKIEAAVLRARERQQNNTPTPTKAELMTKKEQLLAIIRACHQNLVLPRFDALDLALTEEQSQFIHSPTAIRIRTMKTRWGSCNYRKGTLNFNLCLIDQPMECVEYVVMHEFAHFVHPNHSAAYHSLMSALMPDWKQRKARLRE